MTRYLDPSPAPADVHRSGGNAAVRTTMSCNVTDDATMRADAVVRAAAATSEPLPEMPD